MKPPMGNMYSFCSHFARADEVLERKPLSGLRSEYVPLGAVPHAAGCVIWRSSVVSGTSIREIARLESHR
jgi:hypothetical protein